MDIINLLISLASGAAGGNIAGSAMSEKNLGVIVNTVAGLIGGGLGDFLLKAFGVLSASGALSGSSELDIASILTNIGASGVSGGALTAVIALIKDAIQKSK